MSSAFEGLPKTPNLKLNKPGYDNVADIEALNENADILDEEIQGIKNTFVKSVNGINAGDGGNVDLGIIPISKGGTGQTTASGARNALGLGNTTGALPIANGGTGATTAKQARANLELGNMALEDNAIADLSANNEHITIKFADNSTKTIEVVSGLIRDSGGSFKANVRVNGGLLQMRFAVVDAHGASGTVTFFEPFSNNCMGVFTSMNEILTEPRTIAVKDITSTGFGYTAVRQHSDGSIGYEPFFYYFAVGY